jgi:Ca-activated chloride channel homolog
MRFETPLAFILLIFLPLFFLRGKHLVRDAISFTSIVPIDKIQVSLRARIREKVLRVLWLMAYIMFIIALARPQTATQFVEVEASGRDIVIALDVSGSMSALDFSIGNKVVNRITALKELVKNFIDMRKGDRIALVVFGTHAYTQSPFTLDTESLKNFVSLIEIGISGKATAIGDAIAVSLKHFRNIESDSRVLILVTDGESNAGSITPREAALVAKEMNVKIHTIGIGEDGYAPFPARNIFGRETLVRQKVDFDEQTLIDIAESTGGRYFNAKDTNQLEQIYLEIDALEERIERHFEYVQYKEEYMSFVLLGLLFLLSYEVLHSTVLLRIP